MLHCKMSTQNKVHMLQKLARGPQGNMDVKQQTNRQYILQVDYWKDILPPGFLQQNQSYKAGQKVYVWCKQKEGNLAMMRLYKNSPLYTLRSVTQNFVLTTVSKLSVHKGCRAVRDQKLI